MLTCLRVILVLSVIPCLTACDPFASVTPMPVNLTQAGPLWEPVFVGENVTFYGGDYGTKNPDVLWNFGGAGTPNISTERIGQCKVLTAGTFNCSLSAGGQTLPFTLTVVMSPPVVLTGVSIRDPERYKLYAGGNGFASAAVDWTAWPENATYSRDLGWDWEWDFGGGANWNGPQAEVGHVPLIMGAPGTYRGHVTATNAAGSDTVDFDYTVLPAI